MVYILGPGHPAFAVNFNLFVLIETLKLQNRCHTIVSVGKKHVFDCLAFSLSKRSPYWRVLAYILSTYKKINRPKSLIMSGYENLAIVLAPQPGLEPGTL